jgi:hypothetical protein
VCDQETSRIGTPYIYDISSLRVNEDNSYQIDLQERIKNTNKTYFMLQKFFKNKNVSKEPKLILKNTIIDKTVTHASETWMLTKRDRKQTFFKGQCIEEF